MSLAEAAVTENDPVLKTDFAVEMVRQMRAIDSYGTFDSWPVERILEPFILTKEKKREIPIIGDPDEIVLARVKAFYNAISALIEKECGLMAVPMLNLTHEGFGRALITVGKLVVMDRTLRDVHRFGFPSLSKMKDEADKILSVALNLIGEYSKVAGL
jgi:probable nitrogen fixation protein